MSKRRSDLSPSPVTRPTIPWSQPGILVGVDGSEPSHAALSYAADLARKLGLPLHVLAVWDNPSLLWGDPYTYFGEPEVDFEANAKQLVNAEIARVFPDEVPDWVTAAAWPGSAARTLIDASADAEMLVVGSRGHGGFAGLLLGSVSSACASHAHCPVVVVRDRDHVADPGAAAGRS
ncbi:universal stress protein [Microbacterium sp. zg-YB36]|uniref:universal stress protein n=1 Tax=Microbacterium sp. zg-YB36 TaxID=2969407 RepID=UPI00214CBB72|nr:universal stress protein [Microbacterium sp. zg-YB36]MDL5350572.1 universal stress protein [Microbacterium sp. zg-YB36]